MPILPETNARKVAICVPSRGLWCPEFGLSLAHLMAYQATNYPEIEIKLIARNSTLLSNNRLSLARAALEANATHVLWLDDDQTFPAHVLQELLAANVDLVGAAYPPRLGTQTLQWTRASDAVGLSGPRNNLAKAKYVGFGVLLMRTDVLRAVLPDCFGIKYVDQLECYMGEDNAFFDCARAHGFSLYVDLMLSSQIGHIGTFVCEHAGTRSTFAGLDGAKR